MPTRVLVASPVRQKPLVLTYFLRSLGALIAPASELALSYYFVDDNDDERASKVLDEFSLGCTGRCVVEKAGPGPAFNRDNVTHHWTGELVWRVAGHKNTIIRYALDNDFDYLFLVDSDVLLHPNTLVQLLSANKDVIAEVFWTKWRPDLPELPQVWCCDHYTLYELMPGQNVTQEEAMKRQKEWLSALRKPGIYRVGGLGACTLIARRVLEDGINFSPLYNISFWGEDRHFCLRAVAHGYDLFVDTHYPAFHIYRDDDIQEALAFLARHGIAVPSESGDTAREVINSAVRALMAYGTTACYRDNPEADLHLFAPELRTRIYQERMKVWKQVRDGHIVTHTDVLEASLDSRSSSGANVSARIKNFGLDRGTTFLNELGANVCLREDAGRWVVTSVDFQRIRAGREDGPAKYLALNGRVAKSEGNRITLAMVVRNEADRYLRLVLEQARDIVDDAVIIDDASTDRTAELVEEVLKDVPLVLIRNRRPLFEENEAALRQTLWNETIKTCPDWILCLDADEIFEDKGVIEIRKMVDQAEFDYYSFRIFDFWDDQHYREEPLWSAHFRYYVLLIRYQPHFNYVWSQNRLHCGRFPSNITVLPGIQSPLRVKHLGWKNPRDRLEKYLRYMRLDKDGVYGIRERYESILDPFPRLIRWQEKTDECASQLGCLR